jgi:hypothetical protein
MSATLKAKPFQCAAVQPGLSIIECLDDPALFAPHFPGDTWGGWRVFLKGMFALTMTAAELDQFKRITSRTVAPAAPFREAALVVGRRGGKSRVLAFIATYLATCREYTEYLAPGEMATVAIIAADRKQARTILRYILGMLKGTALLAPLIVSETGESVILSNRVAIEITTASFRVTRGYTLIACLADEIAFWRNDETSANPDEEILSAVRPALASIPGSLLLLASSPYAKRGALYKAYKKHFGKDDAKVLVVQASTQEMNPRIDPEIIADAYEDDAANAAAEYGAQFRDDIAAFVARAVVEACTAVDRRELLPQKGCGYFAFCDPSGGSADSMTLAIAHHDRGRGVTILDAVREIKPPFQPSQVVAEFAVVIKSYGLSTVHGDRYAGEWPRERFTEHGITYELSDRPKSDIYRDSLPLMNSRMVELLDIPRLANQLCDLERRTARGGRDSIDHPPGGHDDLANAAAGAILLASGKIERSARVYQLGAFQCGRLVPIHANDMSPDGTRYA